MKNEIRVWDPLVRIFHWSLVAGFTIAYLTGEEESSLHIYSGYAVLGLITFRVVWGFIGTRYARFSDFIYSQHAVSRYLKSLVSRKPEHYVGHNPAGGWMVIIMLASLFVVSISGLKLYAVEEGLGPLAGPLPAVTIISPAHADDNEDEREGNESGAGKFWEEIHEASTNFMLFLVFLHITGVIISGRLHDENLVKAMLTGKKTRKD
ncbi:cytochrome b [Thiogranum longum]|uniref:Cytochrome b n=1 Tax=Thiogranum longum TaxID=1537524 RepID=A0A4R1HBH6_9GAMM|nr:cytochrome b/b6 domain-containing protein [Thiogranum longum]TCK17873.1 cytochrome b [Thiogranum longum]